MAKLEFDNGPEHSVRNKAFIFAHQFIRSFKRFSVEDFRFSMNIDSTLKSCLERKGFENNDPR